MPKVSALEEIKVENENIDKESEKGKAEIEVSLPCGKSRVKEGEKYTIKRCQIQCCSPEEAMNPGLDIELVWGNSWSYEVELVNLLDMPIYLMKTISPKCTITIPFVDEDRIGDYFPIIVQQNPMSNVKDRFEIRLSRNEDLFSFHNASDDCVMISYPVMPESKIRISVEDQLSLKTGEKIFSYNITYDPNDWW